METQTAQNTVQVGSIFYSSWGYDQTNIDFYRVTKMTKTTVTLQRLECEQIEETGFMTGEVIPSTVDHRDAPIRRKLKFETMVKIDDCSRAYLWDGKPKAFSSYA